MIKILIFLFGFINVTNTIKHISPSSKPKTRKMVEKVLKSRASKWGLGKKDYPLILAMMKTETDFKHMKGQCKEVGMLQVIPHENHIKRIVARIKCRPSEKYCKKVGRPDIYSKKLRLSSYKVKRFLWAHPKYALETGLGEMQFWKNKYKVSLKKTWWDRWQSKKLRIKLSQRYKKTIDKTSIEYLSLKKRWQSIKRYQANLKWVNHYNWGSRITTNKKSLGYGFAVLKWYKRILKYNKKMLAINKKIY